MSRARPVILPTGEKVWFDMTRQGERASDEQIELLAVVEEIDLDDLLDAVLTQAEVLRRLREALGQSPVPREVIDRREAWRRARQSLPICRKCDKKGDSTRHHFVNKWILRELTEYAQKWADRSKNCIPVCIDCHRRLHIADEEAKSIVEYLSEEERDFAEAALTALSEQRPKLLLLIARGDPSVYETRLVRDWIEGRFAAVIAQAAHLRAVA